MRAGWPRGLCQVENEGKVKHPGGVKGPGLVSLVEGAGAAMVIEMERFGV